MSETFSNCFTFPDRAAMLSPEQVRTALSTALGVELTSVYHELGEQGAPRAWMELKNADASERAYVFWDPTSPYMEIQILEPMLRMTKVNAVLTSLGGRPEYDDSVWRDRQHARIAHQLTSGVVVLSLCAIAIALVVWLKWWGVLIVVSTIVLGAANYFVALFRSVWK